MEFADEPNDKRSEVERMLWSSQPSPAPPELRKRIVGRVDEWLAAPTEPPLLDSSRLVDTPLPEQRPVELASRRAAELPVWERMARRVVALTLALSAAGYVVGGMNDERQLEQWLGPRRDSPNGSAGRAAIERESLLVRRWAKQLESWWEHRDDDLEKTSDPQNRIVPGHGAGHRGGVRHLQDLAGGGSARPGTGGAA